MTTLSLLSASVLVGTLALSACGASSGKVSGASSTTAVTLAATKLFYDFPLQTFANYQKTVQGINYSAEVVLHDDGQISHLRVYSGQGGWFFNLSNGSISEYFPHSGGGRDAAAPANDGNVVAYLDMLKLMQTSLQTMQAPAPALSYVAQVISSVSQAYPYGVSYRQKSSAKNTVSVSYIAATEVDILVDIFAVSATDGVRRETDTWVGKGRVTVAAGTGEVDVKLDQPIGADSYHCFDIKALPVGGDYTQALAKRTFCDGQRPY